MGSSAKATPFLHSPLVIIIKKNQEQVARSLGFRLYKPGLTTKQVSGVF